MKKVGRNLIPLIFKLERTFSSSLLLWFFQLKYCPLLLLDSSIDLLTMVVEKLFLSMNKLGSVFLSLLPLSLHRIKLFLNPILVYRWPFFFKVRLLLTLLLRRALDSTQKSLGGIKCPVLGGKSPNYRLILD